MGKWCSFWAVGAWVLCATEEQESSIIMLVASVGNLWIVKELKFFVTWQY